MRRPIVSRFLEAPNPCVPEVTGKPENPLSGCHLRVLGECLEHRQIVFLAEQVAKFIDFAAHTFKQSRPNVAQDLRLITKILHALAPS